MNGTFVESSKYIMLGCSGLCQRESVTGSNVFSGRKFVSKQNVGMSENTTRIIYSTRMQ